ncbi:hypothetical protein [uncultured Kingella sp.]|jgi:hypothetical protein|uniref:phage baseplate plug family protein n=1 Tax=Kingella oralis TaxID=505 RepID=UPI00205E1AE6|nr:hypothetical protein [uncultured Kingella sp.]DAT92760.1 MAG TPA: hypothetical protein [Caudoviricetes sp.]
MLALTLADANDFVIEAELDGAEYALHFAWNDENGYWALGLENADGVPQLEGLRIRADVDILAGLRYLDVPQGVLFCDGEPDRMAFVDGRAQMVYAGVGDVFV